ncbi:hypothetical protein [Clostridium amazonitimonense]|uniref:hypothetical protein n=1 Tax=Clostridium amazonitimonense TaxID=1499689 RepID=UPI0005096A47|nr:hypothetical protein [Clostridium amazonitimonense]
MKMYFQNEKVCASCKYYETRRIINSSCIEVLEMMGRCSYKDGFFNMNTFNMSRCSSWKRL